MVICEATTYRNFSLIKSFSFLCDDNVKIKGRRLQNLEIIAKFITNEQEIIEMKRQNYLIITETLYSIDALLELKLN